MSFLYTALTIGVVIALAMFGIGLLPDAGPLPGGIVTAIHTLVGYITSWGYLIDFSTFFTVLALVLGTEVAILFYKVMVFILKFIRGVGTGV